MTITHLHPSRSPAWAGDLREVLGRMPTRVTDLEELLCDHEVTAEELDHELRARTDVYETDDGWVHLFEAADGVVLTHVLADDELAHGVLVADGDLDLWARLANEGLGLADGGEVRSCWMGGPQPLPVGVASGIAGPDGWLDAYEPGQLLALRLRGDYLSIEALDAAEPDDTVVQRYAQVAQHASARAAATVSSYLNDDDDMPWALLEDVIASLVVADADVLAEPLPPLGMLLSSAGMQVDSGFVALAGVPGLDEFEDFDGGEIAGLVLAQLLLTRMAGDAQDAVDAAESDAAEPWDAEHLRQLLSFFEIPVVAERLADSVEERPLPENAVQALLDVAGSEAERGLALLLAARSSEGSGDYLAAERYVDEAAALLPSCVPVASDAGQYAAARGDAVRADAILRASGCQDDDPLRQALKPLLKRPESVISRNRPCPCGSDRKYKACCLRHVRHPLPTRAGLAFARLICHGRRPRLMDTVARFALSVEEFGIPVSVDLALFDGGIARDYLDRRGHLLADDERRLVEAWCETPLAPYEVTDVRAGRSVTLRPLLGGQPVVLADRTLACVSRLDVLVARPLWDGVGTVPMSHPGHVQRTRRGALLALFDEDGGYDPDEVAGFFGPQPETG